MKKFIAIVSSVVIISSVILANAPILHQSFPNNRIVRFSLVESIQTDIAEHQLLTPSFIIEAITGQNFPKPYS